jgi:hypothetical protein
MTTRNLAIALVLLAACKNQIDNGKLEANISSGLAGKGLSVGKVTCPSGHAAKAGDEFTCEVSDDAGSYAIKVTQQDDQGNVLWKLDGQILDTAAVVADASSKMPGAHITCAKKSVVVKSSDTYKCAIAGAAQKQLVITVDGASVGWQAI